MILGKNTTLQKQYQTDCYNREEFYKILSGAVYIQRMCSSNSGLDRFSDYDVKNDLLDFTIWNIFYPLPLIKEIYITNYAGGWESDQSSIHIEYWDNQWKMRRLLKFSDSIKPIMEEVKIITKYQIFPEIIQFIKHIDTVKAKQLLRNYNINQLI